MSSFLYLLTVFSLTVVITGCQVFQPKPEPKRPSQPSTPEERPAEAGEKAEETPERVIERRAPRVGVILGAGGVKAFAHVGVLKAFEEAQIPIHAVVGLEWGSLVGALYAANGSANDLEWQLFKLSEEDVYDVGLLGASKETQPTQRIRPYLEKTLGAARMEGLRIRMACPTKSLLTEAFFWLDQGPVSSVIRLCMSYPPFFQPTQNRYAAVDAIAESVARLKKEGAELIIFINVLEAGPLFTKKSPGHGFRDVMLWADLRKDYQRTKGLVDEVVGVYIDDIGVNDFASRRQVVVQARNAAAEVTRRLVEKYGF